MLQSNLHAPAAASTFSEWLFARLSGGELLHTPPYSSGVNLGRLATAYARARFQIAVADSRAAECQGRDVVDVIACDLMLLPTCAPLIKPARRQPWALRSRLSSSSSRAIRCVEGRAEWPSCDAEETARPAAWCTEGKSWVTHYDSLAHHAQLVGPRLLEQAGCSSGRQGAWRNIQWKGSELLAAGAVQRCSDMAALEELLLSFDQGFLKTFNASVLPRRMGNCTTRAPVKPHCELDLAHPNTWEALRRVAMSPRNGFSCPMRNGDAVGQRARGSKRYESLQAIPTSARAEPEHLDVEVATKLASIDAPPTIAVMLLACFAPFASVQGLASQQQRNVTERVRTYQRSFKLWARRSSLPLAFVENCNGDLSRMHHLVPPSRRASVEFLSMNVRNLILEDALRTGGDLPENRPDQGIGVFLARSALQAVRTSWVIRRFVTRPNDLIFVVTARYFIPDFDTYVRSRCYSTAVLRGLRPWPRLALQNPSWRAADFDGQPRQETQVVGFVKSEVHELFEWSTHTWALDKHCFECHVTKLARERRSRWGGQQVCELPSMPLDQPTPEGSTRIVRESV